MKFCDEHWTQLRDAIKVRGLFDFVSGSGEEAVKNLVSASERPTKKNYDPLMSAHNMIIGNAINAGGAYLLGVNPDGPEGHYCPVCEAEKHDYKGWIDLAADGVKQYIETLPEE